MRCGMMKIVKSKKVPIAEVIALLKKRPQDEKILLEVTESDTLPETVEVYVFKR